MKARAPADTSDRGAWAGLMDELLNEFLRECGESLAVLGAELMRLEREPRDPQLVARIFRLIHSIKGTCGFLDLYRLEAVAHAVEDVIGRLRDGEMVATPAVITAVLEALDRIREILGGLANDLAEPADDDAPLIAALNAIARDQEPPAGKPIARSPTALPALPASGWREPLLPWTVPSIVAPRQRRRLVDLTERPTTLAGEFVQARNEPRQAVRHGSDQGLGPSLRRLNQTSGAPQAGVTKPRLQAIGTTWGKLPRLIRNLADKLDKEIELELRGAETELDRQVLKMIEDPLTHMVRNAVDHGLEPAAERRRLGKPEKGTVGLSACREGDHVIIEISDDGTGLDTRRIAAAAVARGLVGAADVAAMTEADVQQFIFLPGFSTATTITVVSGRGVGMDVVRTNIEKIGGSIRICSRPGQGSLFTIKIPRTPATAPVRIPETMPSSPTRRTAVSRALQQGC